MKLPKTQELPVASGASGLEARNPIEWREDAGVYRPELRDLSAFLPEITVTKSLAQLLEWKGSLLVFIEQNCARAMEEHVASDPRNEQAGILCGQAYTEDRGQYVTVTSALAVDTLSGPTHFTFHEKSWEGVWDRIEDGSNIVGWYHSHPALGVFLSATDLRTQRLYFSAPWQIAAVLDPVNRATAVFRGADGQRVPAERVLQYHAAGS